MNKPRMIRVLAVDDHELVRKGIRFALLSVDDIELVAEASSGEEALRKCGEVLPDIVIMDMLLGGELDGVAAIRNIHKKYPAIQILALSSFYDRKLVQGAMQAGAIGYQVKGGSAKELEVAIRSAYAGRPTIAGEALEALVQTVESSSNLGYDLTPKEREVLPFLVKGLSNPEIAEKLYLSVAAVKYHVSNILAKLGAANRTEAVALALEHNLLPKNNN